MIWFAKAYNSHLLGDVLRPDDARSSDCVHCQQIPPASTLTYGQGRKIIHHASSKYPIACSAKDPEPKPSHNLDSHAWRCILEVGNATVMEEVKNTDTGKCPGDNVGEDGARRLGIHRRKLCEDIVQLGQAVDDDEYVGDLELLSVPKDHPS